VVVSAISLANPAKNARNAKEDFSLVSFHKSFRSS
jgi:hypothetical protein